MRSHSVRNKGGETEQIKMAAEDPGRGRGGGSYNLCQNGHSQNKEDDQEELTSTNRLSFAS